MGLTGVWLNHRAMSSKPAVAPLQHLDVVIECPEHRTTVGRRDGDVVASPNFSFDRLSGNTERE